MAGAVRSLFESGDGLELALHARSRSAIADAEQFDHLIGYLATWEAESIHRRSSGGPRMVDYGGSGTPKVSEFAVAEIAAALGLSPAAGVGLVADVLDLEYRLPSLYACLHAGTVEAWRVRKVATATREFTLFQVCEVDRRLAAETLGDGTPLLCRVTRSRLKQILDQIRNTTRPDDADDETRDAQTDRYLSIRPIGSGLAELNGLLSGEDGQRLDQRHGQIVSWLHALGDARSTTVLRSVAVGYLAEPDSLGMLYDQVVRTRAHTDDTVQTDDASDDASEDPAADSATEVPSAFRRDASRVPRTILYLHLDRASGTWSMDGAGAITRAEAEQIVGHSQVVVKPVIDLAQNLTYTGYVAPPKPQGADRATERRILYLPVL